MDLPERKHPGLKAYDYRENGCYFVTFCVKDRKCLLGRINVGRDAQIPPQTAGSFMGQVTEYYIKRIPLIYDHVALDKYVVMPNHVHLLLTIVDGAEGGGMRASRPTLHTVVRSLKTMVTKKIGQSIWQDSYYEHIVRNEREYQEIWTYIDENPAKWAEDRYYNA